MAPLPYRISRRPGLVFFLLGMLPWLSSAGGFEGPGVGAKALSMGGAFVGLADDWTATFWNPAGLAQLEGTGAGIAVNELFSKTFSGSSMANPTPPFTQQNIERGDAFVNLGGEPSHFNVMNSPMNVPLPSLGAYHRWGNWVGAASVHVTLGFSSDITDNTIPGLSAEFKDEGYVLMSGFSLARELGHGILLGAGFHLLTGHVERHATKSGSGYVFNSNAEGNDSAVPEGVLGFLWKMNRRFQIGAVYRTPAVLHLSGQAEVTDSRFPLVTPLGTLQNERSSFTTAIYNPATYGVGIAYHISVKWLVTTDWQGTDWRSTREKTTFSSPGLILRNQDFDAGWKFTHRLRLGTQYRPFERWSWRAGFARDPQALPDEAQSLTHIVDITRYFYTGGVGWSFAKSLDFDLGYQYGYGSRTIAGVDFRRESHSLLLAMNYRFN